MNKNDFEEFQKKVFNDVARMNSVPFTEFERTMLAEFDRHDDEYLMFLNLWLDYRHRTRKLGADQSARCHRLHQKLFRGLPRNKNYERARDMSTRIFEKLAP